MRQTNNQAAQVITTDCDDEIETDDAAIDERIEADKLDDMDDEPVASFRSWEDRDAFFAAVPARGEI